MQSYFPLLKNQTNKIMESRRKKALPPWLQGVTVKKGRPVQTSTTYNDCTAGDVGGTSCKDKIDCQGLSSSKDQEENESTGKIVLQPSEETSSSKYAKQFKPSEGATETFKCNGFIKTPGTKVGLTKSEDTSEDKWTAEKAVEMSYAEFLFKGSIIYSHNMDDCNLICDEIISSLDTSKDTVIGFDMEWPVTYEKGNQAKTALIQLCLDTERCYLFHVSCMAKFPVMLRKLIEMQSVKKVGLNIENDLWKLGMDFDIKAREIIQNCLIELKTLANKKLKSAENWSLEGLAKNVLQRRISKDPLVRKCDWQEFPLPEAQQLYAATDAVVSLMIYDRLMKR